MTVRTQKRVFEKIVLLSDFKTRRFTSCTVFDIKGSGYNGTGYTDRQNSQPVKRMKTSACYCSKTVILRQCGRSKFPAFGNTFIQRQMKSHD